MATLRRQERRVFVDTSAFFALFDSKDTEHEVALAVQERLVAQRWQLYTTNFVVAETHSLTLNRLGRSAALQVLIYLDRTADTGELAVVRITRADERRAREIIVQYDDKDFSLTDATSFAVMERLRIPHAFTFDRHFAQYGLTTLTTA